MPDIVNIYVRGDNNGNYEGMTKEEILAAIAQAISGGTIGDVDTGFVTKIKEQNKGLGLMFWVGTTAEYEALEERPNNVLYIKTDDTSASDINAKFTELTTALQTISSNLVNYVLTTELTAALANYAPKSHASSSAEYGAGTANVYGHVKLTDEEASGTNWEVGTYAGKAVSGEDAKAIVDRVAALENNPLELPIDTVVISTTAATAAVMAERMGYGTWELLKHDTFTKDGGGTVDAFYYQRTV